MRKLSFITILLLCATTTFAQMGKLTQATSYFTSGKLDQAKKLVDEAINHEKCINNYSAYFVKGQIYQAIYEDANFKKLDADALDKAWDAFQKMIELDVKNKYTKKLEVQYKNLTIDFTNLAIERYNAENYAGALAAFKRVLEIQNSPILTAEEPAKIDTAVIFNTALAAQKANNMADAEKYYKEALKYGYETARCYAMLASILKEQGKQQESLEYLHKGYELYPDNSFMLVELINYYMQDSTQSDKAVAYLDAAIKQDPNNATYYRAKGSLFERMKQKDKAKEMFEKTLELDPTDFYAQFSLSNYKLDEVNELTEKVNNIVDIDEYNREIEKVYKAYEELIPHFEKSLELKPGDKSALQILKQLYFKLRDKKPEYKKKYEEVEAMLK